MNSGIPLSRGLGSSAAAVVAVGLLQLVPSPIFSLRGRDTGLGIFRPLDLSHDSYLALKKRY